VDVTQGGQSPEQERRLPPEIGLFGNGGAQWRPVSPRLVTVRLLMLASVLVVPFVGLLLLAVAVWGGFWVGVGAVVVAGAVGVWLIRRQVPAISWAELEEELVIRKGRLVRTLVSVPYGRLQYVDVQSGPLSRRLGMADVELHTASPQSGGSIPGLPIEEAEALRTRLAARGEAQRAGL
jgi:membrane protein YdbS with pleckstrin-like domain